MAAGWVGGWVGAAIRVEYRRLECRTCACATEAHAGSPKAAQLLSTHHHVLVSWLVRASISGSSGCSTFCRLTRVLVTSAQHSIAQHDRRS